MGKIKKILENELVGGIQNNDIYPVTSIKAVYDENNERLDNIINRRGVVNISTNYNSDNIAEVLTINQAISKVPSKDRVLGFQGKFLSEEGWKSYIFIGKSVASWYDVTKWEEQLQTSSIAQELGNSSIKPISQVATSELITSTDAGVRSKLDDSIFSLYINVDDLSETIVKDITDILPAGSEFKARLVDSTPKEIDRVMVETYVNGSWNAIQLRPEAEDYTQFKINDNSTATRLRVIYSEVRVKKLYKINVSKLNNTLKSGIEEIALDAEDLNNREAVYTDYIPINKYIKELYVYNIKEGAYLRQIRKENGIFLVNIYDSDGQPYLSFYDTIENVKSNPILGLKGKDGSGAYIILNTDNIPDNTEYVFKANFKSMASNIDYSPTIKKMCDNSFLQGIATNSYLNSFIKELYIFDDLNGITLDLVRKNQHLLNLYDDSGRYGAYCPESNVPYKIYKIADYTTVIGYIIVDWDALPDGYENDSISIKLKDYNSKIKNQYIANFLQLKEDLPESSYFSQNLYNEHPQTIEKLSDTEYTLHNVSNEEELKLAIQNNNSLISFSNDISISTPISLESKNNIVIDGNGYNIVQKGNVLSSTGKIIGKLKEFEFPGGFNGRNKLITDKGDILYLSETPDYIAESEFIKVDGYENRYKLKYPSNITLDIKESDNVYIKVTAWFVSMFTKVIETTSDGYLVVQYSGGYSINGDYEFARRYCAFKLINYTINDSSFVYKNNKIYAPIKYNKLYNISLDNIFSITSCGDILFRDIKFKGSDDSSKAVIDVISSSNIYVNDCGFYNLSRAINSSENSSIYCYNSNFKDIEYESVLSLNGYVEVQKCYFENCNTAKSNTCCIESKGDYYIADNTMVNFGYCGIRVGIISVSSDFNSSGIIESNHLYYTRDYYGSAVYNVIMDSGAIYVATNNKNCIIRYNIIHDIAGRGSNRGIFVDDGGYNISIVSNLIYRIQNSYCIDSRFAKGRPTNGNPTSCNNTALYNVFSGCIKFEGNTEVENNNCKCGYNLSIQNLDSYLSRDIVQYLSAENKEDIIYDYSAFVKNNCIVSPYLKSLTTLWKIPASLSTI